MDAKGADEIVCFHYLRCLRVDLTVENFSERKVVWCYMCKEMGKDMIIFLYIAGWVCGYGGICLGSLILYR